MKAPPFLIGAALLFWAQQSGLWALGVVLALAVEGARFSGRRWRLSGPDFQRLGDLCTVLFAVLALYLYMTREGGRAMFEVIIWFPVSTFPLIAAQTLCVGERMDLAALFWSLRRMPDSAPRKTLDASYPYAALCACCAGAANARTPAFYVGLFALSAWALWASRPRSRPAWQWAALTLAAGLAGWTAQGTLHTLQGDFEKAAMEMLFGSPDARIDPTQSRTAMGRLGRLKQSGEIVWRVRAAAGSPPELLRAASYDYYSGGQWQSKEQAFFDLPLAGDGWRLAAGEPSGAPLTVVGVRSDPAGILPLPHGATRIGGLPLAALSANRLGSVQAVSDSPFVEYAAASGPPGARDGPPGPRDLELPAEDAEALTALARELGLSSGHPERSAALAARFFAEGFTYSLFQEQASARPLRDFLFETRSGHCEYFATAAVLLLRAGGIPARYATGYAVREFSALEGAYLLRQRHGHAWTLARLGERWVELDTTPATWAEAEEERRSLLEPLMDLLAWARVGVSRLRWTPGRGGGRKTAAWLLLIVLAWVLWRAAPTLGAASETITEAPPVERPGADSGFYTLEEALAREGLGRRLWETTAEWLERVAPSLDSDAADRALSRGSAASEALGAAARLRALAALHIRCRFDPQGLAAAERAALESGCGAWLAQRATTAAPRSKSD
ncbi:MAG: transglutaminase domain-containing protein [Elusimicrobia bacterium]|nr:transglutaminase domain-containing protein [Elusimicrobiota bacterium]